MAHDHPHNHHQHVLPTRANRAFIIGIVLNLFFVLIEAIYGFFTNSLSLLSDAGHNFSDVISLALALLGFRLSRVRPSATFTYGFSKTTILIALINALLLLVAVGGIGIEATHRLIEGPEELEGNIIALVAGIGIVVNGASAFLFLRDKERDINIKGAYLHMAADALVSVGVVASGLLIKYTQWYWLDSITSYIIMIVIFIGTWNLLKDTLRLSLDGVPKNIDMEKLREVILKVEGVKGIHHIHVWAISTTQNALTAHIVLKDNSDQRIIKEKIKHELQHLSVQHATLETETESEECEEEVH